MTVAMIYNRAEKEEQHKYEREKQWREREIKCLLVYLSNALWREGNEWYGSLVMEIWWDKEAKMTKHVGQKYMPEMHASPKLCTP